MLSENGFRVTSDAHDSHNAAMVVLLRVGAAAI
jgi:hypothetical protein